MTFVPRAAVLAAFLSLAANAALSAVVLVDDPSLFPGGAALTGFAGLPFGETGPVAIGEATLSAPGGLFASGVGVLSTTLDADAIDVTFASPVTGFAFSGGVVDDLFQYLAGELAITVDGVSASALVTGGAASFVGVLSDTGFTSARITIVAFDPEASSVGFAGLEGFAPLAPIPLPAAIGLLAAALVGLVALRYRATT